MGDRGQSEQDVKRQWASELATEDMNNSNVDDGGKKICLYI